MRLTKLFVMAVLVGSVAVIGCSEDENGGTGGTAGSGGTAGTGGTAGDGGTGGDVNPCTTGPCADVSAAIQDGCSEVRAVCNSDECCELPGAGGAGGTMSWDPTPEQCDAIGQAICELAGAGGAGGDGGTGGAGPDLGCDVLACETDEELKAQCEAAVEACFVYCENDAECAEDECLGLGVLICNVEG